MVALVAITMAVLWGVASGRALLVFPKDVQEELDVHGPVVQNTCTRENKRANFA